MDPRDRNKPHAVMGALVVRLRQDSGISRPQLSELSGIPYPLLANLETGRRRLSDKLAVKVAGALGVELQELLDARNAAEHEALKVAEPVVPLLGGPRRPTPLVVTTNIAAAEGGQARDAEVADGRPQGKKAKRKSAKSKAKSGKGKSARGKRVKRAKDERKQAKLRQTKQRKVGKANKAARQAGPSVTIVMLQVKGGRKARKKSEQRLFRRLGKLNRSGALVLLMGG